MKSANINNKKTTLLVLLTLFVFLCLSFKNQENNIVGLTIKFRKVSEDYLIPGIPDGPRYVPPIAAIEGMKFVKLKLTLKNEGEKDCIFNFEDVYISTEKDSLYRFYKLQDYFVGPKTKIKPHKELKRIVLFQFPDEAKPKELFIEDKRFEIKEEEE